MRLNIVTRFPHPVLEENSSDYSAGVFNVEYSISECRNTGNITVRHEVELSQPDVAELVEQGRASVILFVESLRTYYNQRHII